MPTRLSEAGVEQLLSDMGELFTDPSFGGGLPAAAYNPDAGEVLVVWEGIDDSPGSPAGSQIYGQRVNASTGQQLGSNDFLISADPGREGTAPQVIYNPAVQEYLVAWHSRPPLGVHDSVAYRRLNGATGTPLVATVSRVGTLDPQELAMAYNSVQDEYLLVWNGIAIPDREILGLRLDGPTATPLSGVQALTQVGTIGNPAFTVEDPDLAYRSDGDEYLLVWSGNEVPNSLDLPPFGALASGEMEIFAQRLDGAANPFGAQLRLTRQGPLLDDRFAALEPKVQYLQHHDDYLLFWRGDDDLLDQIVGEMEVYAQKLDVTATPQGQPVRLSRVGPDAVADRDVATYSVTYSPLHDEALVVWSGDQQANGEHEIYGQRLRGSDGQSTGADDFRISEMGTDGIVTFDANNPTVIYTSGPGRYLVLWGGDDSIDQVFEVWGQVLLGPEVDLSLSKSNEVPNLVPGTATRYFIEAQNNSDADVVGVRLVDDPPEELLNPSWTCSADAGSRCPGGNVTASGIGMIDETIDLGANSSVTFELDATVDPAAVNSLRNDASLLPLQGLSDPQPSDNNAFDEDPLLPQGDLAVTLVPDRSEAVPGGPLNYVLRASNSGPSRAPLVRIEAFLDSELENVTWSCGASFGSTCAPPASGTGDPDLPVELGPNSYVEVQVFSTVSPSTTGSLQSTARLTPPPGFQDLGPGSAQVTSTVGLMPRIDLSLSKTLVDGPPVAGAEVRYSLQLGNAGPSDAPGARVQDTLDALLSSVTWTCAASGGASCVAGSNANSASGTGDLDQAVDLPLGASLSFEIRGQLPASAQGLLVNSAQVLAPDGYFEDQEENNQDTVSDTITRQGDLQITKSNGLDALLPGTDVSYEIVASNVGPSDVVGALVRDLFPADLELVAWTCVATDGQCFNAGLGDLAETVDIQAGGNLRFTVDARIRSGATGQLANTAEIVAPSDFSDTNSFNDRFTDIDPLTTSGDLQVTVDNGTASSVPGQAVSYTVELYNDSPLRLTGVRLQAPVPTSILNRVWSCAPAAGGTCPALANGNGELDALVDLEPNGQVVFTLDGDLDPSARGDVEQVATVTAPLGFDDLEPLNNQASDLDSLQPEGDLSIVKSDGLNEIVPGTAHEYGIQVSNSGPSSALGVVVEDFLPAALLGSTWTCTASAGSSCPAAGNGDLAVAIDLLPGGVADLTITSLVDPAATGTLQNTASLLLTESFTETSLGDETSTDVSDLRPTADLSLSLDNGSAQVVAGELLSYELTVLNPGPSNVVGFAVEAGLPLPVANTNWSCSGNHCPASSGRSDLNLSLDLPAQQQVVFTLIGELDQSAAGTLRVPAVLSVPPGFTDPVSANNQAADVDPIVAIADLALSKSFTAVDNPINPGSTVRYFLQVSNLGPSAATRVSVVDQIPARMLLQSTSFVNRSDLVFADALESGDQGSWDPTGLGLGCSEMEGGSLTCRVGNMAAGSVAIVEVEAIVDPITLNGSEIANIAQAESATDDNVTGNNLSIAAFSVQTGSADLELTLSADPSPVAAGNVLTYTLDILNRGPAVATGVRLDDKLPSGYQNPSIVQDTRGVCTLESNVLACNVGIVNVGERVQIVLEGLATGSALTNAASTSGEQPDPDTSNNVSTVNTTVLSFNP